MGRFRGLQTAQYVFWTAIILNANIPCLITPRNTVDLERL